MALLSEQALATQSRCARPLRSLMVERSNVPALLRARRARRHDRRRRSYYWAPCGEPHAGCRDHHRTIAAAYWCLIETYRSATQDEGFPDPPRPDIPYRWVRDASNYAPVPRLAEPPAEHLSADVLAALGCHVYRWADGSQVKLADLD